jgi:predicted nucleic acid-binding protein
MNEALEQVVEWLGLPGVIVLHPTTEHARHFTEQCRVANATGNLVSDAHLAALALEHDCELASNDADFAKFPTVRWVNPMVQQGN